MIKINCNTIERYPGMSDYTNIHEAFCIKKGLTAVVGSGGKTSFINALARELTGKIIIATSTHIYPFDGIPLYTGDDISELREMLDDSSLIQTGTLCEDGKLIVPSISFYELKGVCDYLLVEADGSRGLPLKVHNDNEPVIPECTDSVIVVFGLSGIGMPVKDSVHRYELLMSSFGLSDDETASPGTLAVMFTEEYMKGCFGKHPRKISLFFNQNDIEKDSGTPDEDALSALSYMPQQIVDTVEHIVIGSVKNSLFIQEK